MTINPNKLHAERFNANGTGQWFSLASQMQTEATLSGPGEVAATVQMQVSNDPRREESWQDLGDPIALAGIDVVTEMFERENGFAFGRFAVLGLLGALRVSAERADV